MATHREGHHTLDQLLGNETDLPIREHATDTHGANLVNFGLFDLLGKSLTLRIRGLGKITLVRGDSPAAISTRYPHAGLLLADRWNEDLSTRARASKRSAANCTTPSRAP